MSTEHRTSDDVDKAKARLSKARDEVNAAELDFRAAQKKERARRQAEENAKVLAFKAEIAKEAGIENHPKLEKVWGLAWDMGHSYGLNDVRIYFLNLAELVK